MLQAMVFISAQPYLCATKSGNETYSVEFATEDSTVSTICEVTVQPSQVSIVPIEGAELEVEQVEELIVAKMSTLSVALRKRGELMSTRRQSSALSVPANG